MAKHSDTPDADWEIGQLAATRVVFALLIRSGAVPKETAQAVIEADIETLRRSGMSSHGLEPLKALLTTLKKF
ncbi:MAG: hypothetical protein ABL308_05350 [Oceanicaulis sp.]